jgi:hypothetical protein
MRIWTARKRGRGEAFLARSFAVSLVWARVKNCFLHIREESGNRRIYENFEALANAESAYDAGQARD